MFRDSKLIEYKTLYPLIISDTESSFHNFRKPVCSTNILSDLVFNNMSVLTQSLVDNSHQWDGPLPRPTHVSVFLSSCVLLPREALGPEMLLTLVTSLGPPLLNEEPWTCTRLDSLSLLGIQLREK